MNGTILLPDTPICWVDEPSFRVPGLLPRIFRDAHLATDFQGSLREGRRIDDRSRAAFDLESDENGKNITIF